MDDHCGSNDSMLTFLCRIADLSVCRNKNTNKALLLLTEYPMTTVISDRSHGGHATPGLSIECLLPYTKWRLTFSGLLKRPDATEANELQHVAFTFL